MLPQAQSPLFKLPTEIGLYIYELAVLISDQPVFATDLPSQNHFAILQTCRRIFTEAETIFYSTPRLRYAPSLVRIALARRSAITALTVVASSGSTAHAAITKLHLLPNLQSLHIEREVSIHYLGILDWFVLARQMQTELVKLPSLREVKVFTPTTEDLSPAEQKRKETFDRVDALLTRER